MNAWTGRVQVRPSLSSARDRKERPLKSTRTNRPPAEVVDLYKLSVEMADRISDRRGKANQFYLTLQSALLGLPAVLGLVAGAALDPLRATLLTGVGTLTSLTWWLQLRSYRDLNRAKFEVINRIEAKYFEVRPFSEEWASLKTDPIPKWRSRYAELGTVERVVPLVFIVVNVTLAITVWL